MKYSVNIVYLVYMLYLLMFWSLYSDKNVFTDQKLRHASHSTFSAAPESFSTPLSWGSTLSFSWLAENVTTGGRVKIWLFARWAKLAWASWMDRFSPLGVAVSSLNDALTTTAPCLLEARASDLIFSSPWKFLASTRRAYEYFFFAAFEKHGFSHESSRVHEVSI